MVSEEDHGNAGGYFLAARPVVHRVLNAALRSMGPHNLRELDTLSEGMDRIAAAEF